MVSIVRSQKTHYFSTNFHSSILRENILILLVYIALVVYEPIRPTILGRTPLRKIGYTCQEQNKHNLYTCKNAEANQILICYRVKKTTNSLNNYDKVSLETNFIEIALWHRCSPANLLYIFRTPFPKNTSGNRKPEVFWRFQGYANNRYFS